MLEEKSQLARQESSAPAETPLFHSPTPAKPRELFVKVDFQKYVTENARCDLAL